ncbi:hypothetical protein ECML606-1_000098 [Escherichia phage ECML-606-1]|nr:hypothetical protein ECML606-1_000098 [Escherichia phage ECML-606-1]
MTTVSKPNPALPTFEARDIGGTWDITMRIPHKAYGGDTIEQILLITENGGAAPAEETIARRVCALLNMSAHIDTEDLFIKGATLKLQTFSEAVAPAEMTDREKDLRDTCDSLRRALKTIGLKFGVKSSDPELIAEKVMGEYDQMWDKFSQADRSLNEHSEAISQLREQFMIPTSSGPVAVAMAVKVKADESAKIASEHAKIINELRSITGAPHAAPSGLLVYVRNFKENADLLTERTNALANATVDLADYKTILHDIRTALEVDPDYEYGDLPAIAAELFENLKQSREANKETAGQLAKADQALATTRGDRDEAYRYLKDIQRVLGVTAEPKELPALVTKLANDLTSVRSSQTTLDPFKREVMALCMITPSTPDMLPSFPELLIGVRDYVNTITRYRGGAMILHDLACQLVGREIPATDAEPYANVPWDVLAEHLKAEFNGPRNAIIAMADNFELERDSEHYSDAVAAIYHYIKGLSVAQFQHDKQLQTLLTERNADRAIIGAIDDLCSDKLNRPPVPVLAAVRALVRSHLIATERS